MNTLLLDHQNSGVLICGDRNKVEINSLLAIDPSLRQLVTEPTHGKSILDIICTNLYKFYQLPSIIPSLTPDSTSKGVASDHLGVLVSPKLSLIPNTPKVVKYIRPMPDSLILNFQQKLATLDFHAIFQDLSVDEMISQLDSVSTELVESTFPEKRITINEYDQPWFNEQLRSLKRQRLREYNLHGKTNKYLELVEKI